MYIYVELPMDSFEELNHATRYLILEFWPAGLISCTRRKMEGLTLELSKDNLADHPSWFLVA